MKSPAFLFYSSDFLTGTNFMTNEEVGIYIRLMCYQHQKGHLKGKDMKNICNSLEKDSEVFSKFICDENGMYFNERLEIEIQKRNAYSSSRANNRRKKEENEPQKNNKDMKNICNSYDEHMENENDNINDNINIIKNINIKDIIEYLNKRINTKYKYTSKKTQDLIKARFNDGFTFEDFKIVIDKKCFQWYQDEKMKQYLRPETLFGTKFESYLNELVKEKTIKDVEIDETYFNEVFGGQIK